MGDEQKASFEHTAAFRTLTGEALDVKLSQCVLNDDDLRLTGAVTPATFMLLEQEMAFNMLPQVRTPYDAATFRDGIDVEIELMLRPALLNAWRKQGITEIEDMLRAIFATGKRNVYLESETWLLLRAVQPMVVSVEEGTFGKAGFQTRWAKGLTPDALPQDLVMQFLDEKGWSVDSPDGSSLLRVFVGTDVGRWVLLIDVDAGQQRITCYSAFPRDIPASRREIVAEYLFNVNYRLTSGNFEMDEEDGDLRFRTTLFHGSSPVSAEMVAHIIEHNVGTMGDFYIEIDELAKG